MKLSAIEREIAKVLVEALVEYGLTKHLVSWGERSTEDWFWNNELSALGFGASAGLSKVCIWHTDLLNWVIKVGFVEEVSMDYASREYENYCMAEEEGLSQYFPTTVYLGIFGGRPFYLQEYAECEEARISSEWYDRLSEEYDDCEEILDALGSLLTCKEITDEEYEYITKNWNFLLVELGYLEEEMLELMGERD